MHDTRTFTYILMYLPVSDRANLPGKKIWGMKMTQI